MPGRKKSRKVGRIGIPKSSIPQVRAPSDRIRKKKGNKAGTRQQEGDTENKNNQPSPKVDSKVGSKKPIDLLRHKTPEKKKSLSKKVFNTPKEELDWIENDQKLQSLLDKQEKSSLSVIEQKYVQDSLNRHRVLCELMGIDHTEEIEDEVDPLSHLDAISIDDFKH